MTNTFTLIHGISGGTGTPREAAGGTRGGTGSDTGTGTGSGVGTGCVGIRILGPVEVVGNGTVHRPRGPKVRKLLALLAVRAHDVVDVDTVIEELWDGAAPASAVSTVRTHVYHLRQELSRQLGVDGMHTVISTEGTGYSLRPAPGALDVEDFTRLYAQGRTALHAGNHETALDRLDEALALWRGRTLADVARGRVLAAHATRIEELQSRANELRIEAAMRLGRHRELVPELHRLIAVDPLNEWLHARLIDALHRCGRRGEALRAFHRVRGVLAEELGLEPCEDLLRLQQQILSGRAAAS